MDETLYISFLLVSFGLIIVPGPNVLLIVSTSIAHGRERGLQTVAGTSLAMVIQMVIAALGTTSFIHFVSNGFSILKWLGVAYLFYIGMMYLRRAISGQMTTATVTATSTFSRGFIVSLTNPKTILFFGAFMPQFILPGGDYLQQITILSLSFLVLAVFLDSLYAILASRLAKLLQGRNLSSLQNGFSGVMLLGASIWLAMSRRAQ